jgi:translation initiation factor IF-3
VKFLLRFRGREMAYQNLGREKLLGVCDALKDCAIAEGTPRMEGRMMGILLAPSRKKSVPKQPAVKDASSKDGAPKAAVAKPAPDAGPAEKGEEAAVESVPS